MGVSLDVFRYFIEDSIEQRIFAIGGADLLIESPDSNVRILLCTNQMFNLDGTDDESINKIVASFPQFDFGRATNGEPPSTMILAQHK